MNAQLLATCILVFAELIRLGHWLHHHLNQHFKYLRTQRQQMVTAEQAAADAERDQLVNVGNIAKLGLLRNARVIQADPYGGETA